VLAHPAFIEWRTAALTEPWLIADYDAGYTLVEAYR
jgi:glutathione S-transferase